MWAAERAGPQPRSGVTQAPGTREQWDLGVRQGGCGLGADSGAVVSLLLLFCGSLHVEPRALCM